MFIKYLYYIGEIVQKNNVSENIELSIKKNFKKEIMSKFTKAIKKYELVKKNDVIACCVSGGKDSFLMAKLFTELKKYSDFNFEVMFISMDPGYSEENRNLIKENAKKLNIDLKIFETNIFDAVLNIEKSPCYLCARMRRGHLYNYAKKLGANKIALGHHYDDVIETILMSIVFSGQCQNMPPKVKSENFERMELIRPMYLIREKDIIKWAAQNNLKFLRCACKFTEGIKLNDETHSMRAYTKKLISDLNRINPYVESNIFKSMENVHLDTVIEYKKNGVRHNFLEEY